MIYLMVCLIFAAVNVHGKLLRSKKENLINLSQSYWPKPGGDLLHQNSLHLVDPSCGGVSVLGYQQTSIHL